MKMHKSVIDKLIYLCQTYGGYEHENKLRTQITNLDFTPYERKEGNAETILVLTEDFLRELTPKQR